MAAQSDQSDATDAEPVGKQGIEAHNLAQYVLRLFEPLRVQVNQPQPVKSVKIAGVGGQNLLIEMTRFREASGLIGHLGMLQRAVRHGRNLSQAALLRHSKHLNWAAARMRRAGSTARKPFRRPRSPTCPRDRCPPASASFSPA